MRGRRAVWYPVALAGAALLLLACAPAARVSPAPASQAPGTDATFTRPYIEPRPTPTPPPCAQGEAPPGHPLTWTFEERLRCFPAFDSSPTPRPDVDPSAVPTPDPSKIYRPSDVREIVLKGQRVPLPEGVMAAGGAMIDCRPGARWCYYDRLVLWKGTILEASASVQIYFIDANDPVLIVAKVDPNDPTAFDFLKPYVRQPTPQDWARLGGSADHTPTNTSP